MNFETGEEKKAEFREFSEGAYQLYSTIIQLEDGLDESDPIKGAVNLEGRSRAETAARLLKELPSELDKPMSEFRKKVLVECYQGVRTLNSKHQGDLELKQQALKIIEQLGSL